VYQYAVRGVSVGVPVCSEGCVYRCCSEGCVYRCCSEGVSVGVPVCSEGVSIGVAVRGVCRCTSMQ